VFHRQTVLTLILAAGLCWLFWSCALNPKPRYKSNRPKAKTSSQPASTARDTSQIAAHDDLARRDTEPRPNLYPLQNETQSAKLATSIGAFLDARYEFGGQDTNAVDCSGFVKAVFQEAYGIELPRKATEIYRRGVAVPSSELAMGDLLFFSNSHRRTIDHVGIYLSQKKFVHSTVSQGVTISRLDEPYWQRRFLGARRLAD
jgi:cell wall-associated NlpC family hydrolase